MVRKEVFRRRKVWKLKEDDTRARFKGRVRELVSVDAPDVWKSFKEGVLRACDEVCGKSKGRRDRGDTWWWNEEVKEAIANKKAAHKEMCKNRTEENKARYVRMRNRAKRAVAKAMKEEAVQELKELDKSPNEVFKFVKSMKKDGKDVEGGRCMRGSDGRLSFSEKDRGRVWKEHMEKIMNEENEWDQSAEADLVEGPVEGVSREEVVKAMKKMKGGECCWTLRSKC